MALPKFCFWSNRQSAAEGRDRRDRRQSRDGQRQASEGREQVSIGNRKLYDPFHLQFVLADRAVVLFAGIFHQNDSPWRLPRKIWTETGNIRPRAARLPIEAKINLATCRQRRRSEHCAETGARLAHARTWFALRPDDNHHDWIRS